MTAPVVRLTLLGVGAMRSPRYRPAGLLVEVGDARVMLDGADPPAGDLDAWLVCDERAELASTIRAQARSRGLDPRVARFTAASLDIEPRPVRHTSHPTFAYLIVAGERRIVWAPEFWRFPRWIDDVDLMFAEGASHRAPIHFAHGAGGHMAALDVAAHARRHGVGRLVFAHIGRPSIRAIDAGEPLPFGEWGHDGEVFELPLELPRKASRHGSSMRSSSEGTLVAAVGARAPHGPRRLRDRSSQPRRRQHLLGDRVRALAESAGEDPRAAGPRR
jgi:hypothetical protein